MIHVDTMPLEYACRYYTIRICMLMLLHTKQDKTHNKIQALTKYRQMFCCTKQNHSGQLITSICQQQNCQASSQSQLLCCQCIREFHQNHTTMSMKNILPELLVANNEKKYYMKLLDQLVTFVNEEFVNDNFVQNIVGNGKIDAHNVVPLVQAVLIQYRKVNKEQNRKLRDIQKTLKISNESQKNNSPAKHLLPNYQSVLIKPSTHMQFGRQSKVYDSVPLSSSQMSSIQTFSHTLKHPYITVSTDQRSVIKSSQANGYKLAALSSCPIPPEADNLYFHLRVMKSSGNILIGLGMPDIIRQRQYLNCYGAGQGAFLLGQNGNDPLSAILFHHSDNVFNRKQIVGWNYKEGEVLGVGVMKQDDNQLVVFRKYQVNSSGKADLKKVWKQFTMPLWPKGSRTSRLHILVILQSVNDQVQIIPNQQ